MMSNPTDCNATMLPFVCHQPLAKGMLPAIKTSAQQHAGMPDVAASQGAFKSPGQSSYSSWER